MPRPSKRAKSPPAKTPSPVRQAAKQVAADANQVRQDLNKLLNSLENLSVEALREVSSRALALIDEKNGEEKQSFIGGVVGSAVSIGESIAGLFGKGADPKGSPSRKTRGARARKVV
jgi:hypothetical protein